MTVLIKNGRVMDPSQELDGNKDIFIKGSKIEGVFPRGKAPKAKKVIDASGCIVIPGLVDMHAHIREPGFEYKETIYTGTLSAVKGGITTACCMPNTNPINDSVSITKFILDKTAAEGACTVHPIGAITTGQMSEELTELEALLKAGCIAFSDDGMPVTNSLIMRRALEYSKIFNVPIISHCEDIELSKGGVMNEGFVSTILGLKGIPKAAEEVMVARDISLCDLTKGRLHIAHVSTEGSVNLIRDAKKRGVNVTAETCPHYFTLSDESLINYDTNLKVNPPIRTGNDVEAIKEGLKDGTIDVLATDHAPHHFDDKDREFDAAAFGISGFETAFALGLRLVDQGVLNLIDLIRKFTIIPSQILRINKGTLLEGADADVAIINTERTYTVDSFHFISKGKNSPFHKWKLRGTVEATVAKGKVFMWNEKYG